MPCHKFLGLETEYGIVHRGVPESNPIAASSFLINAYLDDLAAQSKADDVRVGWDFEDESPGADLRGAPAASARPPEVETHLVNTVLHNGARYYVDHAHPELSTPECADPVSIVVWDKAAERIVARSMRAAAERLPPGQELVIYKNNSDGKGNSYGCHENYLVDRSLPFSRIVASMVPHFVSRQIYTGSGKVGGEGPGPSHRDVPYQITQRADFFEAEIGLETTLKRPIINTRDEPHADPSKYRRLHVICADANCAEIATLLKVGVTAILLAMVEHGEEPPPRTLAAPVMAMSQVSRDLSLREGLALADGTSMSALEMQWELYEAAEKFAESHGLGQVGEAAGKLVLSHWSAVLGALEHDPMEAADRVDWVAKQRLLQAYQERHGVGWGDPRVAALALQYHDLRPERSLAQRAGLARITNDEQVNAAQSTPPEDTRAWFRGACLAKYGESVVAANWDSIVFETGSGPLQRVPTMEPARGTRAQVGTVVAESATPAELLAKLSEARSWPSPSIGGHDGRA